MCSRRLIAWLLPFSLIIGLVLSAPAYASGSNDNNQGGNGQGDNNQGNEAGDPGTRPAIPELSGWLAMGVGLLIVGPYVRNRLRERG